MLDDGGDDLATLYDRLHLFRDRLLLVIALLGPGQADVDRARLARDDLDRVDAFLGEVNLTRVGVIDLDRRDLSQDLDGERGGRGDAQPGDDGTEQDRGLGAVDWRGSRSLQLVFRQVWE